ncbi:MAG TPA: AI-2E family transporter [Mycobacteriales bacterium]|nr:AI-2E family transporter [Mycobacteriales bacterium]
MRADDEAEARALSRLVIENADTDVFLRDGIVREAAAGASEERPFGVAAAPLSTRSPFRIGFTATLGAAVAAALAVAALRAWGVLILLLIAAFLAVGLDPMVAWLTKHRWHRTVAAAAVLLAVLAVVVVFIASAVPALTTEYHHLHTQVPRLLSHLQARHDALGRAARKVHISSATVSKFVSFHGVVTATRTVLSLAVSALTVAVLTAYLLANLPAIKSTAYRLAPRTRRARVGLLTDEILRLVGSYLLGNVITSAIAGAAMFVFLLAVGVPDALFLGLLVALFDLIPMIGAPVAGIIVALVALSVSVPIAIATVAFTLAFRVLEDYLLSPRVMKATVEVAPVVTVVAVLVGGSLLGIVGALIAVPVAAALDLIRREIVQPNLDAT